MPLPSDMVACCAGFAGAPMSNAITSVPSRPRCDSRQYSFCPGVVGWSW
ncbi:hypothetical protein [Microbispora sitophila]|nr:hypothetical protein [Microbispora sitophila]